MTRIAVVGHVEWVEFLEAREPLRAGAILHADRSSQRAAGGGGVAAAVLAELGAEVAFFTALGRDGPGEAAAAELRERGVEVHVAWREAPTRRAVTLLDPAGERTIVTIGERLAPSGADGLPWERLDDVDGAFFTAGDASALRHARRAGVLVASPRGREALRAAADVALDAIVLSGHDERELRWASESTARARFRVETLGAEGGRWSGESAGRWDAVPLPGPARDAYGCGDSFVAGLTLGLSDGRSIQAAARLGAEAGARALTRAGAP